MLKELRLGEPKDGEILATFHFPSASDCVFFFKIAQADYPSLPDIRGTMRLTGGTNTLFFAPIVISRTNEWGIDRRTGDVNIRIVDARSADTPKVFEKLAPDSTYGVEI